MLRAAVGMLVVGSLLANVGCVGKKKYETEVAAKEAAVAENETLKTQVAELEAAKAAEAERAAAAEQQSEELKALEAETRASLDAAQAQLEEKEKAQAQMEESFQAEIQAKEIEVEEMKTGVRIRLDSDVLFGPGKVTPTPEGVELLKKAGAQLAETPYQVIVMGHTDDQAVGGSLASKYPSNWELGAARAAEVGKVLMSAGVKGEQLAIGSRASYKPLTGNDTPEGRADNRRIEIFVRFIDMVEGEGDQ